MSTLFVDPQYADVLNVGDQLEIQYPDGSESTVKLEEIEITGIKMEPQRVGDSRLRLEVRR